MVQLQWNLATHPFLQFTHGTSPALALEQECVNEAGDLPSGGQTGIHTSNPLSFELIQPESLLAGVGAELKCSIALGHQWIATL